MNEIMVPKPPRPTYEIIPNESIGPFKLGMTREQILELVGETSEIGLKRGRFDAEDQSSELVVIIPLILPVLTARKS